MREMNRRLEMQKLPARAVTRSLQSPCESHGNTRECEDIARDGDRNLVEKRELNRRERDR